MKKILTVTLLAIMCFTFSVGCGKTPNSSITGTHWLSQPTFRGVEEGFYEKIVYEVTAEGETDKAPALYPEYGTSLVLNIDRGSSFVAELSGENGLYVYRTQLNISGSYTYKEKTLEFKDDFIKTETHFKGFENGFAPVKSIREVKNSYPIDASLSGINTYVYDSTIDYQSGNAVLTVTPKDEVSKEILSGVKNQTEIKKYNKNTFVDNDLMMLMLRNFKYSNSLNYTFSTIEDLTGMLKQVTAKAYIPTQTTESSSAQTAIRPMTIENCKLPVGNLYNKDFDVMGIKLSSTGEFAQDFTYAYYVNAIKDDNNAQYSERHYMVKCYRPAIYNSGYIVYTLSSVTYEKE